jgi:3-dehydroquinate synthase
VIKPFETQTPNDAVYRQRIEVPFEYPVYFTRAALSPDNHSLRAAVTRLEPARRHRVYAVVDSGVADAWPGLAEALAAYADHHADVLELVAPPSVVPGGEGAKGDPQLIARLHAELQEHRIDRQSFVLCIGGGSVLDAVGYAAATTHRGVRLLRLPTTVLSQNDSGVGVKNGINAFGAKNFLGTFAPPFAVLNDADFITTLEPRDLRAGMAEAVKVALIRDYRFFTWLCDHREALARFEPDAMAPMIRTAAEIHMEHIASAGDPFEMGSARPLDFGHWSAHKLESLSGHRVRHGEAVAIGIALDSRYSVVSGLMDAAELDRICALLEGLGLRLWDDALSQLDAREKPAVLAGLDEFREHLGGELTVTLLRGVGRSVEVNAIDHARVVDCLSWLKARDAERCG